MSSERRRYPRHDAWFPVQIDTADRKGCMAVCHDASASGLLLRTPCEFEHGEEVTLIFRVMQSQSQWVIVRGTVVRVDREREETDGFSPWPVWIAVRFHQPFAKLELLYQVAEARQSRKPRFQRRSITPRPFAKVG